jgi:hypothetical protein
MEQGAARRRVWGSHHDHGAAGNSNQHELADKPLEGGVFVKARREQNDFDDAHDANDILPSGKRDGRGRGCSACQPQRDGFRTRLCCTSKGNVGTLGCTPPRPTTMSSSFLSNSKLALKLLEKAAEAVPDPARGPIKAITGGLIELINLREVSNGRSRVDTTDPVITDCHEEQGRLPCSRRARSYDHLRDHQDRCRSRSISLGEECCNSCAPREHSHIHRVCSPFDIFV